MIELQRDGEVYVIRMDEGENRFRPDFVMAWNIALDEVEAAPGPKALVTTGTGKFYSNGLDLEWMLSQEPDQGTAYLESVLAVLGRVLVFPAFSVAALNGHAFGAGALLALAHDVRVMRSERGYFCMPEIDLRAPLHPGMTAILQARLPRQTAHEVIVTGTRYGAELALERRIVDHALPESEVLPRATAIAAERAAKADPVMTRLKTDLYRDVLEALRAQLVL